LDHLDKRFQRRRFKCEKLMDAKWIQTVHIATNVVSLNSVHGKVYSMQNYVINFASDIRQVGGVLQVLLFTFESSPLKPLIQMIQDLVGSIYRRSSIRIANFVSIR
jgi:hypothetical protein